MVVYGFRSSEAAILRLGTNGNRKSLSPEKEDRYYPTRASVVGDENGKVPVDANNGEENKLVVWPKLYITLSNKEKEEDFLAMKGCKPPQRPKKRAKIIQRSLLVSSASTLCMWVGLFLCLLFFIFQLFVLVGGSW